MDSVIPEGAPKNPYHDYVQDYANINRDYHPSNYVRYGAYSWIPVPEEVKSKVEKAVMNLQNMVVPTLKGFSNERNMNQLLSRVYRKMKVYEDEYNACHLACRDVTETYFCGDQLVSRLSVEMPSHIKKILDEY